MNNKFKNNDDTSDNDFVYTEEHERRKNAGRRKINSDRRTTDLSDYVGPPQRLTIDRRTTTKDRRKN